MLGSASSGSWHRGLFQPDTAVAGSWLKNVGQLQQSASVDLSPTQQYLVLIQADASQPTSALYKLESAGANSLGLPGVSTVDQRRLARSRDHDSNGWHDLTHSLAASKVSQDAVSSRSKYA